MSETIVYDSTKLYTHESNDNLENWIYDNYIPIEVPDIIPLDVEEDTEDGDDSPFANYDPNKFITCEKEIFAKSIYWEEIKNKGIIHIGDTITKSKIVSENEDIWKGIVVLVIGGVSNTHMTFLTSNYLSPNGICVFECFCGGYLNLCMVVYTDIKLSVKSIDGKDLNDLYKLYHRYGYCDSQYTNSFINDRVEGNMIISDTFILTKDQKESHKNNELSMDTYLYAVAWLIPKHGDTTDTELSVTVKVDSKVKEIEESDIEKITNHEYNGFVIPLNYFKADQFKDITKIVKYHSDTEIPEIASYHSVNDISLILHWDVLEDYDVLVDLIGLNRCRIGAGMLVNYYTNKNNICISCDI